VAAVDVFRRCLGDETRLTPSPCVSVLGASLVYVGEATLVVGARPDVAKAHPGLPGTDRAGWGYTIDTTLLPDVPAGFPTGGRGTVTLVVVASDRDGNRAVLGERTVTLANR